MNKVHELCLTSAIVIEELFKKTADTNSVMNGLTSAKNEFMTVFKFAINWIAIPIIAGVIVVIMAFLIASCVRKHQGREGYADKLIPIFICLAALTLVLSFPAWGWQMIGESSPPAQSQTQSVNPS